MTLALLIALPLLGAGLPLLAERYGRSLCAVAAALAPLLALGLLLPRGGGDLMPHVRAIAQPELGWDDARWADEERSYRRLIAAAYALPDRRDIPDWRALLATSRAEREQAAVERQARGRARQRRGAAALLAAALLLLVLWLLGRNREKIDHA